MVARIDDNEYKQSMIEAGMIGQVLYLEAEAKGIRGCGIGCFFDDLITKEILNDKSAIALYGFSIGAPLVDERIIKLD
jgi:nitroreductase